MYRKRAESVLKEIVQPVHINYNKTMNMPTAFENCAPNDCVFSVSQITDILKELVETSFPSLTVEGEISNYRPARDTHILRLKTKKQPFLRLCSKVNVKTFLLFRSTA